MQEETLLKAIDEGVSKGVPVDYIAYSLEQAGWPTQMIKDVVNKWLLSNGRYHRTTAFKDWLKKYYKQAIPGIVLMTLLNVIADTIALLRPVPLKILADSVFGTIPAPGILRPYTGKAVLIIIISLMTLAIFLVGSVFGVVKDLVLNKISFFLNQHIKEESFRHILHLPLYHEGRLAKGDYIYRQNDVTSSLSDLVLNSVSVILESVILVVGVLVIMLKINAPLAIITLIVVPFLIVSVKKFGPIMSKFGKLLVTLQSKTSSLITESIDNTETVQAFTLQERQVGRLNNLWHQTYEITKKAIFWGDFFNLSNGLVVILGTSTVIFFGGSEALKHQFTLGDLLLFMTYMGYLIAPIQGITEQITIRRQKMVNVRRIYEVLSDHEDIEHQQQNIPLKITKGKIDFQNVTYGYKDKTILDQVSLTIMPGEKVGIIGPSGAGKSTLLRLLDLYLEPMAGRILIDGQDIQSVSLQQLRQSIAWVSQSPQLFADTIENNIRDGDINRVIDPSELGWAAKASNVSEFVDRLPLGMESIVGEGGSSLSGGQKQRISIARALIKNAQIICLDEPTSALDSQSEQYILESIGSLINGKTVLLVTHRLPLLSLMDKIYVLDQGKLVDVNELGGLEQYTYQLNRTGGL